MKINALHSFLGLVVVTFLAPSNVYSQDEEESKDYSIRVQVMLVEASDTLDRETRRELTGPTSSVAKAIRALESNGKAQLVNQAELTLLNEQESMLQIGDRVSVVSGTARVAGGREIKNYNTVEIGTIIKLIAKVVDDQAIISLDFTKSYLSPAKEDDTDRPQGVSTLTHQSTMKIKDGQSQLVGRMMSRGSDDEVSSIELIVGVEIMESDTPRQATSFRSFSTPPRRTASSSSRGDARPPIRRDGTRPPSFSSRGNSEETRRRIGNLMFDRADEDKDGTVSVDELSSLRLRDSSIKGPITRLEYMKWLENNWPPSPEMLRRSASDSSDRTRARGINTRSSRPTRDTNQSDQKADENSGKAKKSDDESEGDSGNEK